MSLPQNCPFSVYLRKYQLVALLPDETATWGCCLFFSFTIPNSCRSNSEYTACRLTVWKYVNWTDEKYLWTPKSEYQSEYQTARSKLLIWYWDEGLVYYSENTQCTLRTHSVHSLTKTSRIKARSIYKGYSHTWPNMVKMAIYGRMAIGPHMTNKGKWGIPEIIVNVPLCYPHLGSPPECWNSLEELYILDFPI